MSASSRQFKPPWWATALTILLCGLFVSLSLWQLSRADERRELLEQFEAGERDPVVVRRGTDLADLSRYSPVELHGRFLPEREFLLDGQTRDGRPGYHVWTPFEPEDGGPLVVVDRGWIPAEAAPADPPDAGLRTLGGRTDRLPRPGFRIDPPAPEGDWPRTIYYPRASLLEDQLDAAVHDGRVLMDPDMAPGFKRDWQPVSLPPERHLGYAFQWAALAVALLVIYIVVNLRRTSSEEDRDED